MSRIDNLATARTEWPDYSNLSISQQETLGGRFSTADQPTSSSSRAERSSTDLTADVHTTVALPEVRRLPLPPIQPDSRLYPLQEWEGYVVQVGDTEFLARLKDVTVPSTDEEEVALFVDDVSPDDRPLLRPGAIFRWVIGYRTFSRGQRERASQIVFRRLPAWSRADLKRAKDKGRAAVNAIRWE